MNYTIPGNGVCGNGNKSRFFAEYWGFPSGDPERGQVQILRYAQNAGLPLWGPVKGSE